MQDAGSKAGEESKQGCRPLDFEREFGFPPESILPRIERQFGGRRISVEIGTFGKLSNCADFNPFDVLEITEQTNSQLPTVRDCESVTDYYAGLQFNQHVKAEGLQNVRRWLNAETCDRGSHAYDSDKDHSNSVWEEDEPGERPPHSDKPILRGFDFVAWRDLSRHTSTLYRPKLFEQVQAVLTGHNRPKYSKRDIAFRGLMHCAYDGCMVTGEVQKAKYVYYRCTGHRGKCNLHRFREEDIANRLGEPLKGLQVPAKIVSQVVTTLREDQRQSVGKVSAERTRLVARLAGIRKRMAAAYTDKLEIVEDFWERKMGDWRVEEQQVVMAINGLNQAETCDRALNAERIF